MKGAKRGLGRGALHVALLLGGATMIMPLLWMAITALKTGGQVFEFPPRWIPRPAVWDNFVQVWRVVPLAKFFLNSLLVAFLATAGEVVTSAMAAYAFAQLRFAGRDRLFFGYLATLMIPWSVTMIPVFILVRLMGGTDTYWALIVPGIFTAYGTFMLRQFFMTIPGEMVDAARIDGCGHIRIFLHVTLPLSKSAIATLTTFSFMGNWNSFLWPLIVTNSSEKMTLPVGLAAFQGMYGTDWPLLMAGSLLTLLPVILVFLACQKYFVEGMKLSGFGGV
jgi:multiple sugar transport system permease protein